jgi:hypothetical protein
MKRLRRFSISSACLGLLLVGITAATKANDDIKYPYILLVNNDTGQVVGCVKTSRNDALLPSSVQKLFENEGDTCSRSYHGPGQMLLKIGCTGGNSPLYFDSYESCKAGSQVYGE